MGRLEPDTDVATRLDHAKFQPWRHGREQRLDLGQHRTRSVLLLRVWPTAIIPQGPTNAAAMAVDMIFDPRWYWAELAFIIGGQIGGYYFASTTPSSGSQYAFEPSSHYLKAVPLFASLENCYGALYGFNIYSAYNWRGQLAGPGDGSDGQPANQFSWAPSGPMINHIADNESVRGYAALDLDGGGESEYAHRYRRRRRSGSRRAASSRASQFQSRCG